MSLAPTRGRVDAAVRSLPSFSPILSHKTVVSRHTIEMSDSESDAKVLGKRARNGEGDSQVEADVKVEVAEDESDDDVGPMPMPAGAGNGGVKKKRRGTLSYLTSRFPYLTRTPPVLPHEKLYKDHLPSADRYYKSFMHRDVINFVVMTRCARANLAPIAPFLTAFPCLIELNS